jgi:hypothetical protein
MNVGISAKRDGVLCVFGVARENPFFVAMS